MSAALRTDPLVQLERRMRYLPIQLAATERKLIALRREAQRYGMHELLTKRDGINEAWERETEIAKLEAEL